MVFYSPNNQNRNQLDDPRLSESLSVYAGRTLTGLADHTLPNNSISFQESFTNGKFQFAISQLRPTTTSTTNLSINSTGAVLTHNGTTFTTSNTYSFTTTQGDISIDLDNDNSTITLDADVLIPGNVNANSLPVHADEAAAVTAALTTGDFYRTATGEVRVKL